MESHCGAETALAEGTEAPRNNVAHCIMRRHVRRPFATCRDIPLEGIYVC